MAKIAKTAEIAEITKITKTTNSGVRRKFPTGGKVLSISCDVTNLFLGKCRRHDHSSEVRRHAPGKSLQNYT